MGAPDTWPTSLKTYVRTLLTSRFPMFLFWGPELVQFYNDAYRPSLGTQGRHPSALGGRGRECWAEIWDVIGREIESVMRGGPATFHEDQLVPITRDGRREDVYWTYTYSPAYDDEGRPVGVLVVCQESTRSVETARTLRERQRVLDIAGRMARIGGWTVDLAAGRVLWSDEVCAIHEVPAGTSPTLENAIHFYAEEYQPVISEHFARCAEAGTSFDLDLQLIPSSGRRLWVRAIGEAVRDDSGRIIAVQGAFQDIQRQKETEEDLRRSEQRFRELAESMPLIVWTATPEGSVDFQSRNMREFAGRTAEQLRGDGWTEVLHPDDVPGALARWRAAVREGSPYQAEFRIRRADGEFRWHLTRAVPVRDEAGQIHTWYGSATEIHEQRAVRLEAERVAARLATTLEAITDAFFLLAADWTFTFVNVHAERFFGLPRHELLGRSVWALFPPESHEVLRREFQRAVEAGQPASFTEHLASSDRWYDIRAFPSAEGLAVYARDVTAARQSERRLAEQAELIDLAQDAIIVRTLDNTVVFWNSSAERLYGWARAEALGQPLNELIYADAIRFEEAHAAVLRDGEWSGEFDQRRRDGTKVSVSTRWSMVRDEQGAPRRILCIDTDITERRRLTAQFLRAQRMESIGTLAGGIAHDLNNVLVPILLSVDLIKSMVADEQVREVLTTVEQSAERGADMVRQVLGFARGFDRTDLTIDVARLIGDVTRVLRDAFPKNVRLVTDIPSELRTVVGDPTQLQQVLMNLLVNARDAMPTGGEIRLGAELMVLDAHYAAMNAESKPGPYVRISVSDTGTGMAPEVLAQIFDPFFTTKEVGKGTGLGLSTVAAIVKSHGGFVNVYSELGNGSTFRVYLPAAAVDRPADHTDQQVSLLRGNGQRILVIDDESAVRDISRRTLEAFGYRVITAVDGADAVATYAREGATIDLVLTDMVMPLMDGPATIVTLKRMNPAVRIIAASGLGAKGGTGRASEAGVQHFLPKPYTAETLLRTVHEVLSGK